MSLLLLLTGAFGEGGPPPEPPAPPPSAFPSDALRILRMEREPEAVFARLDLFAPAPMIEIRVVVAGPFTVRMNLTAAPATVQIRSRLVTLQTLQQREIEDGQILGALIENDRE